jgi:MFS family permease
VISKAAWRIVLLASLGGTLEFYDFVIFGVFARDIGEAIFPSASPIASLVAAFTTFAIGYLARPLGGIVLSHYGDRYGRRRVFLVSIFVMSGATFGMGLVPTYAAWGVAASILMISLRFLQGFCLGGELPGALTYVVETAPKHAPFVCGVVFCCVTLGVAVATGVSLSVRTYLPPDIVPAYGWRIAFMLGGLGGLVSYGLRRSLEESPEFARMKALAVRHPFREVLTTHFVQVLLGVGVIAATAGFNGLYFSYMAAYMSGVLKFDPRQAVTAQTIGVITHAFAILATGRIADYVKPRVLVRIGSILLAALAFPFFNALVGRSIDPTALMVAAGILAGLVNGTFAVLLTDLFPTKIRFSGVALGFNIAFTLFSGTAPLVATSLIQRTGSPVSPAWVMVASGLITFVVSLVLPKYGRFVLEQRDS